MITLKGIANIVVPAVLVVAVQGCSSGGMPAAWNSSENTSMDSKVKAKLASDDELKGYDLGVETTGHTVRLTGLVDTRIEQERAVEDAQQVAGVANVLDDIALLNGAP